MTANENLAKTAASESAAALVTDGMLVGLGSGTTAAFAVAALGRRVRLDFAVPRISRFPQLDDGLGCSPI